MRKSLPNVKELKLLTESFGGWEKLMNPLWEPTEEVLLAFENIGLRRSYFLGMRKQHLLSPHQRQIETSSVWFLMARNRFSLPMSKKSRVDWKIEFENFWMTQERLMQSHDVTLMQIREHIATNEKQYEISSEKLEEIWPADWI